MNKIISKRVSATVFAFDYVSSDEEREDICGFSGDKESKCICNNCHLRKVRRDFIQKGTRQKIKPNFPMFSFKKQDKDNSKNDKVIALKK